MNKKANTVANYTAALKGLSWGDTDEGFYEWIVVEADMTVLNSIKYLRHFEKNGWERRKYR